jgi:hypothetical protein
MVESMAERNAKVDYDGEQTDGRQNFQPGIVSAGKSTSKRRVTTWTKKLPTTKSTRRSKTNWKHGTTELHKNTTELISNNQH